MIRITFIIIYAYLQNINSEDIPEDAICYKVIGERDKYWAIHWYGIFPNPPQLMNAYGSIIWENGENKDIMQFNTIYLIKVERKCFTTYELFTANYLYTSLILNYTIHIGKDKKNPLTQILIKLYPLKDRSIKIFHDTMSFMYLYTICDSEELFVSLATPDSSVERLHMEFDVYTYNSEYICLADKMTKTSLRPSYGNRPFTTKAFQALVVGVYSNGQLSTVKRFNAWPCSNLRSLVYLQPLYLVIDDIENYQIIWKLEGLGEDGITHFPRFYHDAKNEEYFTTKEAIEVISMSDDWLMHNYRIFIVEEIKESGKCFNNEANLVWKTKKDSIKTHFLILEDLISPESDFHYYKYYSIWNTAICE